MATSKLERLLNQRANELDDQLDDNTTLFWDTCGLNFGPWHTHQHQHVRDNKQITWQAMQWPKTLLETANTFFDEYDSRVTPEILDEFNYLTGQLQETYKWKREIGIPDKELSRANHLLYTRFCTEQRLENNVFEPLRPQAKHVLNALTDADEYQENKADINLVGAAFDYARDNEDRPGSTTIVTADRDIPHYAQRFKLDKIAQGYPVDDVSIAYLDIEGGATKSTTYTKFIR